jgi:hypothetical protein
MDAKNGGFPTKSGGVYKVLAVQADVFYTKNIDNIH